MIQTSVFKALGSVDLYLSVGPVEVNVSTVRIKDLSRGMGRTGGREENDCIGNLAVGGHALAQGYVVLDRSEGLLGVVQGVEPAAVHRGHDLRGDDRIYAHAPLGKIESPFPGERVHGPLAGGVPGGPALTGNRNLGANVDYIALGLD